MANHTPGPWTWTGEGDELWGLYGSNGERIVETDCGFYPPRGADAALIAAAPELLRELKKARVLLRLLTVGQVIRAGDEAIDAAGLNRWCMNEGLATGDEPISSWQIDAVLAKAESEPKTDERSE